jgi:hypothetical protein
MRNGEGNPRGGGRGRRRPQAQGGALPRTSAQTDQTKPTSSPTLIAISRRLPRDESKKKIKPSAWLRGRPRREPTTAAGDARPLERRPAPSAGPSRGRRPSGRANPSGPTRGSNGHSPRTARAGARGRTRARGRRDKGRRPRRGSRPAARRRPAAAADRDRTEAARTCAPPPSLKEARSGASGTRKGRRRRREHSDLEASEHRAKKGEEVGA